MSTVEFLFFRGVVKGLAAECAKSRKKIQNSSGDAKRAFWDQKRSIGLHVRAYSLAYAYVKGKKFRDIEGHTDVSNEYKTRILALWVLEALKSCCSPCMLSHKEQDVIKWLKEEPAREKPALKPKKPYTRPESDK